MNFRIRRENKLLFLFRLRLFIRGQLLQQLTEDFHFAGEAIHVAVFAGQPSQNIVEPVQTGFRHVEIAAHFLQVPLKACAFHMTHGKIMHQRADQEEHAARPIPDNRIKPLDINRRLHSDNNCRQSIGNNDYAMIKHAKTIPLELQPPV